jgi:hypothetical protein
MWVTTVYLKTVANAPQKKMLGLVLEKPRSNNEPEGL